MQKRTDEETQRRAIELYKDPEQGLSLDRVGRQLGISRTSVWSILVRNNVPRRSISEACMKYPKRNFASSVELLARFVGFIEDCGARHHGKQIEVQTGTTHLAMIRLFKDTFGEYGHVGMYPVYNRGQSLYQWQLYVELNPSFEFVAEYKVNPMKFLRTITENGCEIVLIASLIDTEGHVGIVGNEGHPRAVLVVTNDSRGLLEWTQRTLGGDIYPSNGGNNLQLYRESAVEALRRLPIMHEEKAAAKKLILHYADNGGIGTESLRAYRKLRRRIDAEVRLCTMQARLEYIRRKGKPHEDDLDQSIPPI